MRGMNMDTDTENPTGSGVDSPDSGASLLSAQPVQLPQPRRPHKRTRGNGKVARLAMPIRNMVNQSLRDGVRYVDIIATLKSHGYHNFQPAHLGNWVRAGYRTWLTAQETFERSRQTSEATAALLGSLRADGRCQITDLNELRLATQLDRLLDSVDETSLKTMLAEKPEEYFRLTKAVTAHVMARAQRQQAELLRFKYDLEMRKIEEAECRRRRRQGLTEEEVAEFKARIKLI